MLSNRSDQELLESMDGAHAWSCAAQQRLFTFVAEAQRRELWWVEGARDMAHLLSMRYGISGWKADRWVAAALALESLPRLRDAFASGRLGIDRVVELTRFANPDTEESLVEWAEHVPSGRIRAEGDLAVKRAREETESVERSRRLDWWFHDEGRRFSMVADLPATEGALVANAIERIAEQIPSPPDDTGFVAAEIRRADALVALAQGGAAGSSSERATIVIHVSDRSPVGSNGIDRHDSAPAADALVDSSPGFAIEGGGVAPTETVLRLLCNARVQGVAENSAGDIVRLGRVTRDPPGWMLRQLRHRDHGCVFPGCGSRRFVQAHHVRWFSAGGRTDLSNLVLTCATHHKLVHESGWSLTRRQDGSVRWYRPDGRRHRSGPAPPLDPPMPEMFEPLLA